MGIQIGEIKVWMTCYRRNLVRQDFTTQNFHDQCRAFLVKHLTNSCRNSKAFVSRNFGPFALNMEVRAYFESRLLLSLAMQAHIQDNNDGSWNTYVRTYSSNDPTIAISRSFEVQGMVTA